MAKLKELSKKYGDQVLVKKTTLTSVAQKLKEIWNICKTKMLWRFLGLFNCTGFLFTVNSFVQTELNRLHIFHIIVILLRA